MIKKQNWKIYFEYIDKCFTDLNIEGRFPSDTMETLLPQCYDTKINLELQLNFSFYLKLSSSGNTQYH